MKATNMPQPSSHQSTAFRLLLHTALMLPMLLAACASDSTSSGDAAENPAAAFEAASTLVSADEIKNDITVLSADDMEGRGPGSDGDVKARNYIAQRMEEMGLEPGGTDGTWEQLFDLVGVEASVPETWTFSKSGESEVLSTWDDFIAGSGVQSESAAINNAELVFVGYGIEAPEYGWDDYKGLDTKGKVLVMLNNDPDWSDDLFEGNRRLVYGRWTYKYEQGANRGAAGVIIIHTTPSAGYPWKVVQTSWTGEQFELPAQGQATTDVKAWVTEDSARKLFSLAGVNYEEAMESARSTEFEPISLGVNTSLELSNTVSSKPTANVIGKIAGTDSELSDEHLVYSAHHDHLGIGPESLEDRIYNGAMDNASGVAQLLQIAKAVAANPTRRSNLFVFVGAEEQGLLGSAYYARNPTVPAGKMAANINYDGGNFLGLTKDITYIGYGKSSLDAVIDAGAALQDRKVFGDQFPDKGFFYRSDQFNFAKIGVPAIYLDGGTDYVGQPEGWGREQLEQWTEVHYHQPSDEILEDWNFDGMVQDTRLGLYAGLVIGNEQEMPTWNQGDEFEAARLDALAKSP